MPRHRDGPPHAQYTSGKIRIVLQMATEPDQLLPGVPLVTEFAKTPEDRAVLDLIFVRRSVTGWTSAGMAIPKRSRL